MKTEIIEKNNIVYLLSNQLHPYKIAISLKSEKLSNLGDMSNNFIENKINRDLLFNTLGIKKRKIVHLKQIHSANIENAKNIINLEGDGLYSNDNNIAMYILTADCFNIFFTTNNNKTFGIIHAGWKGIINGIIENLRDLLKNESSVIIAQGICEKHFEVRNDVKQVFSDKYGEEFIKRTPNDKFTIDLRKIIHNILKDKADIHNIHLCNMCQNDKLFSYRKGDLKYRNMSIIWR